jgi:hypothetical protein
VTERLPVAWVTQESDIDPTASDRAYLIDAHGYVIRPRALRPEYAHLPIISGVVLGNLALGQRVKEPEILAALDLVRLSGEVVRYQIRHIDVSKGFCLIARGDEHAPIIFGLDNIEHQWNRFNRILDYAEANHKEVRTANLLVSVNTPVVFIDPDAEPPVTPEPIAAPPKPPAGKAEAAKGASSGKADSKSKPAATPKAEPAKTSSSKSRTAIKKPFRFQ